MLKKYFKHYIVFALITNPIAVFILLILSSHVLGIDTSRAGQHMDPLFPYLLVRWLFLPIYLIPVIVLSILISNYKEKKLKSLPKNLTSTH